MKKEKKAVIHILLLDVSSEEAQRLELQIDQIVGCCMVEKVSTVGEFAATLDELRPDLLLIVHGHDIDTLALLREVRTEHPDVPIVVVTEELTDLEAIALIDAGAKGYVRTDGLDLLAPTVNRVLSKEGASRKGKAVERDLRGSLEQLSLFRALIDQSSDCIEIIDPETLRIIDANETAWRSLGYSRDELLSLELADIDPTVTSEVVETVGEQLSETGCARFEGIHRRKDGSQFPVEINLKEIELGRLYRLSVARDISTRKRGETELLRLNRLLRMLSEGNRTMLRSEHSAQLMREMCHIITTCGDYPLAWIGLTRRRNGDHKTINPVAMSGEATDYVRSLHLHWDDSPEGRGPAGKAVRTGCIQILQNLNTHPDFGPWRDVAQRYGLASSIALPMKDKEQTFGILSIYARAVSAFNQPEVELLQELTRDLAAGLLNLRIRYERDRALRAQQYHAEHLRASMTDTVQAIATVAELRDAYTAGHQWRVADLAVVIAREMGLQDEQVQGIHLAALVHDIGKIQIPSEILTKPKRLNNLEYELVKTHSQAGYDILKGISFPWPIAQTVLQHHERLDGSGYPLGLVGDQILIEARIVAVADVVESMASHRPYRPALGIDKALDEVRTNRGILYETVVVDACLSAFSENDYQFPIP